MLMQSLIFKTFSSCLFKDLVLKGRLILKRRLVYRNLFFDNIKIKIKIRHIAGG